MARFSPHDRLFQATFRSPRLRAAWLRRGLPAELVALLAIDRLQPHGDRAVGLGLRAHFADLVFEAPRRDRQGRVLVVVEHKADTDPELPSQLLRYVVHLRRVARQRGRGEPAVVTAVLHHARERWQTPTDRDPPPLAATKPSLPFAVDDLAGQDEATLRDPRLPPQAQLTLLALATLRWCDVPAALAALDRWGDLLAAIDAGDAEPTAEDALDAISQYVLETTDVSPEDLTAVLQRHLTRTETNRMTTAQRLRSEGLSQGLSQGRSEGQAATLARLLAKRFGPLPDAVAARLRTAAPSDLDRWTDRLLDAPSLEAVFA
ncbi:MAG: Rpn family recombination-promoting nuclease/putative transposase [Planctomycetota bacterium]